MNHNVSVHKMLNKCTSTISALRMLFSLHENSLQYLNTER